MDYGPLPNCGEVWLLSGIWDEQSEIANGDFEGDEINDLVETFMGDLVGERKSLLQHHSSKASILWHSAFFTVQLSHPYMTTGKTIALTRQTFEAIRELHHDSDWCAHGCHGHYVGWHWPDGGQRHGGYRQETAAAENKISKERCLHEASVFPAQIGGASWHLLFISDTEGRFPCRKRLKTNRSP